MMLIQLVTHAGSASVSIPQRQSAECFVYSALTPPGDVNIFQSSPRIEELFRFCLPEFPESIPRASQIIR